MARGSVSVGCGYKIQETETGVVLIPTTNWTNCSFSLGLGDATFKIDPKNPPSVLKSIITGDSTGSYVPKIDYSKSRHTKTFVDFVEKTEQIVDASGNTQDFNYIEVIEEEEAYEDGDFEANGTKEIWDCAEPFYKIFW